MTVLQIFSRGWGAAAFFIAATVLLASAAMLPADLAAAPVSGALLTDGWSRMDARRLEAAAATLDNHAASRGWLHAEAALLRLAIAESRDAGVDTRTAALVAADADARRAIRRSPSNSRAWLTLALASVQLKGGDEAAARWLAMSIRVAPKELPFVAPRAAAAIRLWPYSKADERRDITGFMRMAREAKDKRSELARCAGDPIGRLVLRAAMKGHVSAGMTPEQWVAP